MVNEEEMGEIERILGILLDSDSSVKQIRNDGQALTCLMAFSPQTNPPSAIAE